MGRPAAKRSSRPSPTKKRQSTADRKRAKKAKELAQAARLREVGTREDRPGHHAEATSKAASGNTSGDEAADAAREVPSAPASLGSEEGEAGVEELGAAEARGAAKPGGARAVRRSPTSVLSAALLPAAPSSPSRQGERVLLSYHEHAQAALRARRREEAEFKVSLLRREPPPCPPRTSPNGTKH